MSESKSEQRWVQAICKGQKVFLLVDGQGKTVVSNGFASVRYQNKEDAPIYSPRLENISRLSKAEESAARPSSSSKQGIKRKPQSQAGPSSSSKARTGWNQSVPSSKESKDHAEDAKSLIASFAPDSLICFTDGACRGNPGPCGAGAVMCLPSAGMTAQEAVARPSSWIEKYVALGHGTNNIGELTAIELAFQLIEQADEKYRAYKQQHPEVPEVYESKSKVVPILECQLCGEELGGVMLCSNCGQDNNPRVPAKFSTSNPPPRVPSTVHILSDSKYSIGILTLDWKAKINVELVARIRSALARLSRTRRIQIHWVKGHAGVPGNERADQLANKGVAESSERRNRDNDVW